MDNSDSLTIIQDQLRIYGGRQKLAGDYRMVPCAFHDDKDPSMGVYLRRDHPTKTLGYFNCFAIETEVITRTGVVSIGDIVGKKVEVLTKGGKWVQTQFKSYGKQHLYKMAVSRKNETPKVIYTTAGHIWNVIPNGRRGPIHTSGKLTTLELPKRAKLESVFPKRQQYTVDMRGVQHGFTFGDGTLDGLGYSTAYFCGDKTELMQYFSEYTDYVYHYPYRSQIGKLPVSWKELPTAIDKNYLAGFLAGLIAADGCLSKGGSITISNSDIRVIRYVRDIALRLGITVRSIRSRTRDTNYKKNATICGLTFNKSDFPSNLILSNKHRLRITTKVITPELEFSVVSIEKTKRFEEVFCCEVEGTHSFALEGYILTGNCLGCGAHGDWNVLAEKAGLTPIKKWNSKEKHVEYNTMRDESALLGDSGITLKAVYREMKCPEAQPWPENLSWRGVSGKLIAAVGGKAINDEYNNGLAVLFPIKLGKRIRGGVKAMFHKKTPQDLGYITMSGEWVKQFGLFPHAYTAKLIRQYGYKFVILVEGPRDALRLLKLGLPAIAVLGANTISNKKMLYITSLGVDQIYVLPDNDRGGTALWRNVHKQLPDAKRLKLPMEFDEDGKLIKMDPFSMPSSIAKEIKAMMRERHGWKNPRRYEQANLGE